MRRRARRSAFAAGNKVDDLFFFVRPEGNGDIDFYVDEVALYDAGGGDEAGVQRGTLHPVYR